VKTVYALVWKMSVSQEEFGRRVPEIMTWLRGLRSQGRLVACGGAGAAGWDGGVTVIHAASPAEAIAEAERSPQASMGTTEVVEWEVYFADLSVPRDMPPPA
jgi:hypothetical protein